MSNDYRGNDRSARGRAEENGPEEVTGGRIERGHGSLRSLKERMRMMTQKTQREQEYGGWRWKELVRRETWFIVSWAELSMYDNPTSGLIMTVVCWCQQHSSTDENNTRIQFIMKV